MSPDHQSRTKTIARNSLWTSLDTIFGIIPHLIISVIVARKLGPDNLGYFNYVMWFTAIAGRLGLYGMGSATRKYVAEYLGRGEVDAAHGIIRKNLRHQLVVASGMSAAAIGLILVAVPSQHRPFAFFASISLFPMLLMVVYSQAVAATENFRANVLTSIISTVVNLVSVLVLLYLDFGLLAVTFSLFLSRMVDLGLKIIQFHRHFPRAVGEVRIPPDEHLHSRMSRFYWLSSMLLVLDIVVWDRSELVILKMFSSIRQLAFYSLAYNISTQLLTIPQMIAASGGASLMVQYGRDSRKTGTLAATTLRYICLLAFPALLGLAAVSTPLLRVVYGWRYIEAAPVLMWLAVTSIPRTMMMPVQQQVVAFERQTFLLKWGVTMAVVNIGLDLLLIRHFGALGAAWANGFSQTLSAGGIIYYAVRHLNVPVNFANLGKIFASAGVMALSVTAVVRLLPPLPALLLGIPLGMAIYPLGLRFTGAMLEEDYYRFALFLPKVPTRWRPTASRVLRKLIVQPSTPVL